MQSIRMHVNYRPQKRIIILISLLIFAALGPLFIIVEEGSKTEDVLGFILLIAFSILIAVWCYLDSIEQNRRIGIGFRLLIVFFGVIALFYYLVKSRGLKHGLLSIAKAVGLIFGGIALVFVSGMLYALIFDIPF